MGSVLRLSDYRHAASSRPPERCLPIRTLVSAVRDEALRTTTGHVIERRFFSDGTCEQVAVLGDRPFGPHRFG